MTGFVYAIAAGELVKIGYSTSPIRRLVKLKTDNGLDCTLLGSTEATKAQEKELLALLSPWKERGEWFRRGSHAIERLIASLSAPIRVAQPARKEQAPRQPFIPYSGFYEWLLSKKMSSQTFAKKVGIHRDLAGAWAMGEIDIESKYWPMIQEHTGLGLDKIAFTKCRRYRIPRPGCPKCGHVSEYIMGYYEPKTAEAAQ